MDWDVKCKCWPFYRSQTKMVPTWNKIRKSLTRDKGGEAGGKNNNVGGTSDEINESKFRPSPVFFIDRDSSKCELPKPKVLLSSKATTAGKKKANGPPEPHVPSAVYAVNSFPHARMKRDVRPFVQYIYIHVQDIELF